MVSLEDINHVRNVVMPLLEQQHNVKIIFLVESGSRMWGFPSDDSDLDCRGVYVPSRDALLGTSRPSDVISYKSEKDGHAYVDLDIWSIQKFGKHLMESNPSLFEWLQSPIVYYCDATLMEFAMQAIHAFDRATLRKHYVSMAIGNYKQKIMNNSKVRAKKYIYVLRAIACVFCLDAGVLPPVLYEDVIGYLPETLQEKMQHYISIKQHSETMEVLPDSDLETYMLLFIAENPKTVHQKQMVLVDDIEREVIRVMNLGLI